MTNVISVTEFAAEYRVTKAGGGTTWYPCRVVGVVHEGSFDNGRFIMITEGEDGQLHTGSVQSVRPLAA